MLPMIELIPLQLLQIFQICSYYFSLLSVNAENDPKRMIQSPDRNKRNCGIPLIAHWMLVKPRIVADEIARMIEIISATPSVLYLFIMRLLLFNK